MTIVKESAPHLRRKARADKVTHVNKRTGNSMEISLSSAVWKIVVDGDE